MGPLGWMFVVYILGRMTPTYLSSRERERASSCLLSLNAKHTLAVVTLAFFPSFFSLSPVSTPTL